MSKHKKAKVPPMVTVKTVTVCFSARTITIDGRRFAMPADVDCYAFPIVSTDAVVMPREPWLIA